MRNSLRSSSFSLEIFLRSGMGEACLIFLQAADDVVDVAVLPLLPPELFPLPPLPLYFAGGIGGVVAKLLLLICMLLLLLLAGFISVVRLTLLLLFMFLTLPLPLLLLLLLANSGVVTRAL